MDTVQATGTSVGVIDIHTGATIRRTDVSNTLRFFERGDQECADCNEKSVERTFLAARTKTEPAPGRAFLVSFRFGLSRRAGTSLPPWLSGRQVGITISERRFRAAGGP
jgi:hypothetical protein